MSRAEVLASVDMVALRLNEQGALQLLLLRRAAAPFADSWALPGVLVNGRMADASLDDAAARALRDKARVEPTHLEQVATVGNAERDPRGWSLSTIYLALLAPQQAVDAEDLRFVELAAVLDGSLALPFDHTELVAQAVERLAAKAVYSSLPLSLLAERFTVTEALAAFQACLGQAVQHTTLRGRLERMKAEGWLRDTGERNRPPMGRPQNVLERVSERGRVYLFDRSMLG